VLYLINKISIYKSLRSLLFLAFICSFTSCVIYYKTADIDSTIQEFRKALNKNHVEAQKMFKEQEVFYNNLRNSGTKEPYASGKKRVENLRYSMHLLNKAKLEADNIYKDFKSYTKGIDKIASNTEEWMLFKETKRKMEDSKIEMQKLFDDFSGLSEEYRNYMEKSVMPIVKRFNVADYLITYNEAIERIVQYQQNSLEVIKKNRDILNSIYDHLDNRDLYPYPMLNEQLQLMDMELKQLNRTKLNMRALIKKFSVLANGFTEIWTSFPEWPAIEKVDKQIRDLLDDVKDVNTACHLHANKFETIVKKENIGEIDAPALLQKTIKYLEEFNHNLSVLKKELSYASDSKHKHNLPSEEKKVLYREQLELISQYIVELEGLRTEINTHYNKLNTELKGENMVWIGPGMAAWDAVDALKSHTNRVNIISDKIKGCSKIVNDLKS